jgi:CheY-like chemotaxis protein
MLDNLLSNAIKYTEVGEVEVSCLLVAGLIEIRMSDTGIGVPPEMQASLFDEFKRGKDAGNGVGLGLALTKALAELNDGSVHYVPSTQSGSIFSLRLPAVGTTDHVFSSKLFRDVYPVHTLLVIDDDPAACRSTARTLSDLARVVAPAHSIEEARSALVSFQAEVIVSDYHLNDGTLRDLLPMIPDSTLLIVVSGEPIENIRRELCVRKNTILFQKPAEVVEIRAVIAGDEWGKKVA